LDRNPLKIEKNYGEISEKYLEMKKEYKQRCDNLAKLSKEIKEDINSGIDKLKVVSDIKPIEPKDRRLFQKVYSIGKQIYYSISKSSPELDTAITS